MICCEEIAVYRWFDTGKEILFQEILIDRVLNRLQLISRVSAVLSSFLFQNLHFLA